MGSDYSTVMTFIVGGFLADFCDKKDKKAALSLREWRDIIGIYRRKKEEEILFCETNSRNESMI